MENNRGQWGSTFGFIMAAVGSAVGLGNIWGFPYKCGANGGGAFVLVYLILVISVGVTTMLGELAIGRKTGRGAVGAYTSLSKKYTWIGYMGVASGFIIVGFYSVLGGIVLRYMLGFLMNLLGMSGFPAEGFFGAWIANMPGMLLFYAIFMIINIVIVMGGISGGIEKFSKIAMPALFAMLLIIIVYVACQPGAAEGYKYMWIPDFNYLFSNFFTVLKVAAGQMFFSLSLGMGCMITYGSYLSKKEDLSGNSVIIPVADTIVALMAGMAVLPACSAYGMEFGGGPGLLFVTMQTVFTQGMGGFIGNLMGFLFYFLVLIAAITSSISLLEVCTAFLIDKRIEKGQDPARKKMTLIMAVIAFVVGLPTALDGLGTNVAGGAWMNNPAEMFGLPVMTATADWLDFYDFLAEGVLMPLGAMVMSILIGWVFGTKMVSDEVEASGHKFKGAKYFEVCFKFVVPVIMAIVLVAQITSFLG